MEYHKGQPCIYKPILCQEGHCSECYIHRSRSTKIDKDDWIMQRADAAARQIVIVY